MRVEVDTAPLLAELAEWLSARGWPVVEVGTSGADVLLPWEEDEFAASLRLRADVEVWRRTHGSAVVSVDPDVWPRTA